ncbi:MAG TPA: ATP-dependent DNA helicase RecG, partial [Acidobacteriaceae bacterium]|nr:ATP-dependent DNA helicase RecG [Acidobacteriaceae bacterium]
MLAIDTPVQFIKGIGPRIAESLAEKGVATAEDLLYHLPFRYEDRANPRTLHELVAGETASVIGEVRGSVLLHTRAMPIFEMTLGQGTGTLKCIWFRGTYLKDRFQSGQTVAVFGKVEVSRSSRGFKMIQPQFEILPEATEEFSNLEMGRITPIYESLGGTKLGPRWVRRLLYSLLGELRGHIP